MMVRDWRTLGYTYPEFVGLDFSDAAAVRAAIGKIVNQLYGDPARLGWSIAAVGARASKEDPEAIAALCDNLGQTFRAVRRALDGTPTEFIIDGSDAKQNWYTKHWEIIDSLNK